LLPQTDTVQDGPHTGMIERSSVVGNLIPSWAASLVDTPVTQYND